MCGFKGLMGLMISIKRLKLWIRIRIHIPYENTNHCCWQIPSTSKKDENPQVVKIHIKDHSFKNRIGPSGRTVNR